MAWQETEEECVNYIKRIINNRFTVEASGGSDSTAPDIKLKLDGNDIFSIEVKEALSQAGQFVVFEDENGVFLFSKRNKCKKEPCDSIISYLNANKEKFKNIGTNGTNVECNKDLMYERVKKYYLDEKKSRFFITKSDNNFLIFPTEELEKYFDISCVARRKKSGSKNVSSYLEECVKEKVTKYLDSNNFSSDQYDFCRDGKYFKIKFKPNISHDLGGKKFETECFNLNFSKQRQNDPKDEYKITILSHTNNPNIIFTLKLKDNNPGKQENLLLNELNTFTNN